MDGENPQEVLKKYHSIIGIPVLLPQYALGWHQSRKGLTLATDLNEAVIRYINNKIPLDVFLTDDADINKQEYGYKFDDESFPEWAMHKFESDMRSENKRFVLQAAPHLAMQEDDPDWPMYKLAKSQGALLDNNEEDIFTGKGVAGNISFFDFTKPETHKILE